MPFEPIQTLDIENYGCIKKAIFTLSPLHALIGPNDSGKSTALRAIRLLVRWATRDFRPGDETKIDTKIGQSANETRIRVHYSNGFGYGIDLDIGKPARAIESLFDRGALVSEKPGELTNRGILDGFPSSPRSPGRVANYLERSLTKPTLVRFDPDYLRAPAQLIPESNGIAFTDERGTGLSSVFDAIINRDPEAFARIQDQVRKLFPNVAKVGLINTSNSQKEIAVTLADGTRVGAEGMSEGLLYYLGFAALQYIEGTHLFLIEEPENGLHPSRIAELMDTLREISKTSQVIIATHSPLVVNELAGHEVTVVTRSLEKGTQAVLLRDVRGYEDAAKVYKPGEFWVSYCDGDQEALLLSGGPRS